ncbi:MAG: hypothetical protein LCH84_09900 [Gemmatimonadetes bacterium]|nr:hypothetical protein [Gemmatimonadota bacterium]
MTRWLLAVGLGLAAAWLGYGRVLASRATSSQSAKPALLALAALRAVAVTLAAALLLAAPWGRATPLAPLVAIDVSRSTLRAAGDAAAAISSWRTRLADSLRAANALPTAETPLVLVGDSLRDADAGALATLTPTDAASRVRPAVDRAASLGRALVLVTDGEVDDPEALRDAPAGSRVITLPAAPRVDLALVELAAPASVAGGDTLTVGLTVVSGARPTGDASVTVLLDGTAAASLPVPALGAASSTRLTARVALPRGTRQSVLQAAVQLSGDVEPRNDTLGVALEVNDRPAAVFVSTAPDVDVREALAVLRGALDVPTRAYLRLAPNRWSVEGTLAPIAESEVRARAREAGLLIVHGDTSWGATLADGARPLARALWVPAPPTAAARAGELARTPEWYPLDAPSSPLVAALAMLPFDSLPPVTLAGPAREGMPVLRARLARRGDPVAAISAREVAGARTVVVSGSGWAGWSLRGGRSRDAFTALWGALFDWLSTGRGDLRAARPVPGVVREGDVLRWRRGGADSVVAVRITPRAAAGGVAAGAAAGTAAAGTAAAPLTVRFTGGRFEAASGALPAGVYDVAATGGSSLLVVNPSLEWVPRAAAASVSTVREAGAAGDAPRLPEQWWPFVLILLLLSAEWVGRRSVGQR